MPNWRNPEFDWDEGNEEHILRHEVDPEEAEQVFFNDPHVRRYGKLYHAYGRDDGGRYLFVVCAVRRNDRVRVVTARTMNAAERRIYDRHR